ncbi:MAG: hypothetical protein IJ067_08655 [Prevotella sp.]|nr:hypothetical protein [Prevotella sp.]
MIERIWTLIVTLCKGFAQGVRQYIDNDLQDQLPLMIFAAVLIVGSLLIRMIKKIKNR